MRIQLGLNQPLVVQYGRYLDQLIFHGNLGVSPVTHNPVRDDIGQFLPASAELICFALVLALALGALLAFVQTLAPHSGWVRLLLIGGASAPVFLTGLLFVFFLWFKLHWFPSGGRTSVQNAPTGPTGFLTIDGLVAGRPAVTLDALWHLFLPGLCLAIQPHGGDRAFAAVFAPQRVPRGLCKNSPVEGTDRISGHAATRSEERRLRRTLDDRPTDRPHVLDDPDRRADFRLAGGRAVHGAGARSRRSDGSTRRRDRVRRRLRNCQRPCRPRPSVARSAHQPRVTGANFLRRARAGGSPGQKGISK